MSTFTASESGATFSATSSNQNVVTVSNLGPTCPAVRNARHDPHGVRQGTCFGLTGVSVGTATVTVADGLGNSTVIAVTVQIPILLSVSTAAAIAGPGDTLTFTAGVNAPGVPLAASSSDSTVVSVAPAANGAGDRHLRNPEATMATNQRFTLTGVASGVARVTVSSTDPTYSPMSILVVVNSFGEQLAPAILMLNQGEGGYLMPFSDSFDETVTSVTTTHSGNITISRPFTNSPIFDVSGMGSGLVTGQITITSNKGSYPEDYVFVEPISASANSLAFPAANQTQSFTVSEPAVASFAVESLDETVATVAPGASTSGATSTATFNVTSVGEGQTTARVTDNLGYEAIVDVIVGPAFTTTPSALSFTAIGQEKTFLINLPPNSKNWQASAASSNESIVKVAFSASQWTAKAIAPGKATIYIRDSSGAGAGLGEIISLPVDVTATGGVIH